MFFSKSFAAAVALGLSLSLQVSAHAAIAPALGVQGTPAQRNALRPSNARPCGNVNIAQTFDTSTAAPVAANGQFQATITNFNGGVDGSTQVTARVDATGTGNSFVNAQVIQNGERAPRGTGSVPLTVQLPAGTTCTGGASGSKCLVAFVTAGGFGNCVVVDQAGGAAAAPAAPATGAGAGAGNGAGTGNGNGNGRGRGRGGRNRGNNAVQGAAAAGTNANANANGAGAGNANANAAGSTASPAAGSNTPLLDRLRNILQSQRNQRAAGTRRARIARRAAERPAVEVLA